MMAQVYRNSDPSLFRDDIDIDNARNVVIWSIRGFSESLLAYGNELDDYRAHYDRIEAKLEEYLALLRKTIVSTGFDARKMKKQAIDMFIDVSNLQKSYTTGVVTTEVLKGICLKLDVGEIGVILGPSGSGKSTLMNIIGGYGLRCGRDSCFWISAAIW